MTSVDTFETAPVIRRDLTAEAYHADRTSVSSSGLRKLLPPDCPAQFKHDRDNPPAPRKTFDLGHAAHMLVLGEGPELAVVEGARWDTAKAKARITELRTRDAIPLKESEMEQVQAMAAAVRQHPVAGPLFTPGAGVAEQSIFWTDPATGIRCRIRPDWLKTLPGLTLCVDYKTCADASPDAVSRAIREHAYHQQDALYIDGIQAALRPESVRFLFVFQSKTAPYLITVRELGEHDRMIGRARNERALRIYADCVNTGTWPDWTGPITDIPEVHLPHWEALKQAEEYLS